MKIKYTSKFAQIFDLHEQNNETVLAFLCFRNIKDLFESEKLISEKKILHCAIVLKNEIFVYIGVRCFFFVLLNILY